MSGKVILEVTQGALAGQRFEYEEADRVFIGRQSDCGIVMPEKTVSRYHCLLDIRPPVIRLQDFGSLNGTFLNGEKIGQRDRDLSWEEAKDQPHEEYELHDGDVLRLGKSCELRCAVIAARPADPNLTVYDNGSDQAPPSLEDAARKEKEVREQEEARMKEEARKREEEQKKEEARKREEEQKKEEARKREEERKKEEARKREEEQKKEEARKREEERKKEEARKREEEQKKEEARKREEERKKEEARKREEERKKEEARKREEERKREEARKHEEERKKEEARKQEEARKKASLQKCAVCGKTFSPTGPDNNLCPECVADRAKVLNDILAALLGGSEPGRKAAPSPVEGYDKVSLLGKGGMGEVWKVKERKTGKFLALKTMLPDVATDENAKQLFLREAGISKCLDHKNVVRAYQTGASNGVLYILMDLCEGGSVDALMSKRGGKLSLELSTYIILQVLSGLDYVHNMDVDVEIKKGFFRGTKEISAKGVVHRDFKPGNIFLSDQGDHPVARVADFGMAKAFQTSGMSNRTKSGRVMGTPVFMPRQQALNFKYAKPQVDIWAAAASYYNMLTGKFPKNFRPGVNPWQIIVMEDAVPIRQRDITIPERLAKVIDRALTEKPDLVYDSAAKLRADIISVLPQAVKNYCKGVIK